MLNSQSNCYLREILFNDYLNVFHAFFKLEKKDDMGDR